MNKPPFVVPSTRRRDVVIGGVVGALILGFIVFGIVTMGNRATGTYLTGTIAAKHFQPQEEQQISLGRGGVQEKKVDGQYTFEVRVGPDDRTYTVWVDKTVYETRKVGDPFRFPRPAPKP